MNKEQKKILEKAIRLPYTSRNYPLFSGIFIIPQNELHDSGYKMMYVIGHTDYNETIKDFEYYLLSSCSDVINFQPLFEKYLKNDFDICDLHLDIDRNGIIHIWTNSKRKIQCQCPYVSSCSFEVVGG